MKFKIINRIYSDSILLDVGSVTIQMARKIVREELKKRGWRENDCYSVEIRDDQV